MSSPYRDPPPTPPAPECGYEPSVGLPRVAFTLQPDLVRVLGRCTLPPGHPPPHKHERYTLNAKEYARMGVVDHWIDPENLDMCIGSCPACERARLGMLDEFESNPGQFRAGSLGTPRAAGNTLEADGQAERDAERIRELEKRLDDLTRLHPLKRRF